MSFSIDCGSRNTEDIVFVTHSCSRNTIEYIFQSVLPKLESSHTVLDVGSRLGAVLYGAYLFSSAGKIMGIEINKELCDLQRKVIQSFGFNDRISIIHSEMTRCSDIFESADIVILNNVFEWFVTAENQTFMWQFLSSSIKVGAFLVTMPSLEKATKNTPQAATLHHWVRPLNYSRPEKVESLGDNDDIYLYQVIKKAAHFNGCQNNHISDKIVPTDMDI